MMADIHRRATAIWEGGKEADGRLTTDSGALDGRPYSFGTRLEQEVGTNPEELLAAAHAGCYAMALAVTLEKQGLSPERIETQAACQLDKQGEGFAISAVRLETKVRVSGAEEVRIREIADEAEQACVISNALRGNLSIEHGLRVEG